MYIILVILSNNLALSKTTTLLQMKQFVYRHLPNKTSPHKLGNYCKALTKQTCKFNVCESVWVYFWVSLARPFVHLCCFQWLALTLVIDIIKFAYKLTGFSQLGQPIQAVMQVEWLPLECCCKNLLPSNVSIIRNITGTCKCRNNIISEKQSDSKIGFNYKTLPYLILTLEGGWLYLWYASMWMCDAFSELICPNSSFGFVIIGNYLPINYRIVFKMARRFWSFKMATLKCFFRDCVW